jgi:Kef-type K+ transport system membrane component KefB
MALSEFSENTDLHHKSGAVMEFMLPFFLVGIGLQMDLSVFKEPKIIILAFLTTLIASLTKLLGCGLAALPLGRKQALQIGVGMIPRGEVGIIVAQIGLGLGVMSSSLYGIVVFMTIVTTLIAPPLLTILFRETKNELADRNTEVVDCDKNLFTIE